MPSNKNEPHLHGMALAESYSETNNTFSWIWDGYTVDVYENCILRAHDDLDYLTLNLHGLIPQFTKCFENDGWQTTLLENGDLKAERESTKIQLGHVELSDKACWTHNGLKGSLWFPREWLNAMPVNFCGIEIHVVAPEFQYVMNERPKLLNPAWRHRRKDIVTRKYLRSAIAARGISPHSLFEQVREVGLRSG